MPRGSLLRAPQDQRRRRAEFKQLALRSQRRLFSVHLSIFCSKSRAFRSPPPLRPPLPRPCPHLPPPPAPLRDRSLPAPSVVCGKTIARQKHCFYPVERFLVHSTAPYPLHTRCIPAPYPLHTVARLLLSVPLHPWPSLSLLFPSPNLRRKICPHPEPHHAILRRAGWMFSLMMPAKWRSHSRSWHLSRPIIPSPTFGETYAIPELTS